MSAANPRKTWASAVDLVLGWPPLENTPTADLPAKTEAAIGAEGNHQSQSPGVSGVNNNRNGRARQTKELNK